MELEATEESVNTPSAETVTNKVLPPKVTVNDQPSPDYDHPPPPTPIYRKVIKLQEAPKSYVRIPGKPVKFPLLSQNYVINESKMEEGIYENARINKAKSPLEIFTFPDPPKEKPPAHYLVTDTNGIQSEYARPESYKGPKIPQKQNLLPKNHKKMMTLSEVNFNPYDQMYSVLSPSSIVNMDSMSCTRCEVGFAPKAKIVNCNGQLYCPECFCCAQCFRPFPDGLFYEFEDRKYCEHCFHVLYAPCCAKCGEFIVGRVIKAMNASWHPKCFCCEMCHKELADLGFVKNQGRALCHECNDKVKASSEGKYMCQKCRQVIEGEPLRFRGEVYCPYHFNCKGCGKELTSSAVEVKTRPGYTANELNELYCLKCYFKMGIPICGACRRPIEGRVVTALGKHWCVEHFVCAKCEKPFNGNRHYERKGLAYCETHYHQLFGNLCYVCNQVIQGDVFTALNKAWCVNHFACSSCDQKMTINTKFYEVDLKPVCKKCYDRYPRELRLRLKKYHENEAARDQGREQMNMTAK